MGFGIYLPTYLIVDFDGTKLVGKYIYIYIRHGIRFKLSGWIAIALHEKVGIAFTLEVQKILARIDVTSSKTKRCGDGVLASKSIHQKFQLPKIEESSILYEPYGYSLWIREFPQPHPNNRLISHKVHEVFPPF